MTVKVNNQLANGQSANQITLTVVDSYGNPLQGQEVTLTLPQECDQQDGEYSNKPMRQGKWTLSLCQRLRGTQHHGLSE